MYGFSLLNQNGDCLLEGHFLFVRKCTDEFRFCRSYGFHSHTVTILPFEDDCVASRLNLGEFALLLWSFDFLSDGDCIILSSSHHVVRKEDASLSDQMISQFPLVYHRLLFSGS